MNIIFLIILYLIGSVLAVIIAKYNNKKLNKYNSISYIKLNDIPIVFSYSWISIIVLIIIYLFNIYLIDKYNIIEKFKCWFKEY
jgi:uncharacterized protein HemY